MSAAWRSFAGFVAGGSNPIPDWLHTALVNGTAFYGLIAVLLVVEAGFPHRENAGDSIRRWSLHGILLVSSRGIGWAIAWLMSWVFVVPNGAATWTGWPHLLLMLLLLDVTLYGLHRLSHGVPLLWRFHALHHGDRILDAGTTWRHHPAEMIITGLMVGSIAGLAGVQPMEIGIYAVLAEVVQVIAHANLRVPSRLARWASVVVVTPALHHAHHSPDVTFTDTNYGEVLVVWDRMFGTFNDRPCPPEFGL